MARNFKIETPDLGTVRVEMVDSSWLGARAQMTTYRVASSKTATRVVTFLWLDDAKGQKVEHPAGTITIDAYRGDGRVREGQPGAIETLFSRVIPADEAEDLDQIDVRAQALVLLAEVL